MVGQHGSFGSDSCSLRRVANFTTWYLTLLVGAGCCMDNGYGGFRQKEGTKGGEEEKEREIFECSFGRIPSLNFHHNFYQICGNSYPCHTSLFR